MDYGLTELQREMVALSRELAVKKIKPVREKYDESEEFPWDIVEELRKADLFGVYLPEEYGGMGGGLFELGLISEQLSRTCGGIALCLMTSSLCSMPILVFGSPEQRQRFLPDIASGKKLGAFCITEPGSGSDASSLKATAVADGDHFILNGVKNFCSSGKASETYVVFFSTNPKRGARGITAFIVEKGTPGFTFGKKEKKMGIRANSTHELVFSDCRVPKANILFKEGMGLLVAQNTFDFARPGVGAQAIGIAQGALDETLAYTRVRKQFDVPVASFQAIGHMLAECATQIEAARALFFTTVRAMDAELLPAVKKAIAENITVYEAMKALNCRRWSKESAMVKVFSSDVAMKVTTDCVQMCGGIGYMRDFPVEKYMRDAKITQIYEGTNQLQREEIARMLVKEAASSEREAAGS
ncbi:MAG: acyl-CoA dehydrogenase [Elusimicrobia bacterium GWA2_69_24]|nr:MAG: acyl-CoA dehydrogenase [Elusimicrobia bacterium GWA2_69_24]HBL16828.1 acyl-CoA dehydrogenase [Elusimicrobiota bacterium]